MSAVIRARWYVPSVPAPDERLARYRNRLRQLGAAEEHDLRVAAGKRYRLAICADGSRLYAMEAAATAQDVEPEYVDGY